MSHEISFFLSASNEKEKKSEFFKLKKKKIP